MIRILNPQRELVAILESAYGVGYEKTFNEIWGMSFSMPFNDPKNDDCQPFNYIELTDENEYIGLFRIIPSNTVKDDSSKTISYQCEHVLATLLDDVLFQYHQVDNLPTRESLQYILNFQETNNWILNRVAFVRYFSYKWENENLLSSSFSVPRPFDQQYQWTFDTEVYPWNLNLDEPETEVTCEIRYAKNLIEIEREIDPTLIYNRIYALGYGEGVNQLTIKDVNNGIPYVEDTDSIAKYGLRSYVFVDRRFENAETLKANVQALLNDWKDPRITYRASAADISSITGEDIDKLKMGRIVRIIDPDFGTLEHRIVKESKPDIIGDPGNIQLEIANKTEDLGTTQSDLERRQQINEFYAQGATNIDSHDYLDNADPENPAEIMFFLPDEMVKINKLLLSFKTEQFRAYERAIEGGGAIVSSTSSGGGTTATSSSGGGTTATSSSGGGTTRTTSSGGSSTQTSSSGGGTVKSTDSGGGTVQSSEADGDHRHLMLREISDAGPVLPIRYEGVSGGGILEISGSGGDIYTAGSSGTHSHTVSLPAHSHSFSTPDHVHTIDIPSHTHSVTIPSHTHTVTIPSHTHTVTIPNHTHDITLPDHIHEIDFGIFKLEQLPTSVVIKVDGNTVPFTGTSGDDIDLIPFLSKDIEGKVNRGWHTLTITPNDLGRISAQIYTQFFIQSRGGGNY